VFFRETNLSRLYQIKRIWSILDGKNLQILANAP
jgi:hypothetical protein